jgi:DNA-binding transcriptional MerR regulator
MLELPTLPDKEYFTIGEVSKETQVPKHTLRYWENEFKLLKPVRQKNGQRRYHKQDLESVFEIKDLLYNKRYTTQGVKKYFLNKKRSRQPELEGLKIEQMPDSKLLKDIKNELTQILKLLQK